MEKITVNAYLEASPEEVFNSWMDSNRHSEFTGDTAVIHHSVGGNFSMFTGYITGKTNELAYPSKIVQSWRTSEFPEDAPDSLLVLSFQPEGSGCRIIIDHSGVPRGDEEKYRTGWVDYYLHPLQQYFGKQ